MYLRTLITLVVLAAVRPAVIAQAPEPGPEHKRLAYFVGTWDFSGVAKDSPMGKGGPITMKQTCELMEGGFAVVCRAEGKSPMGPTKGAAIAGYDAEKKVYTYTAAESNMPVFTAIGTVKGSTWTWNTDAGMGTQRIYTRVTQTEGGPKSYDFTMELSLDGKSYARLVEGKFTKG
jgi:hypothetical protein